MAEHCCEKMTSTIKFDCDQHSDPFECPDALVFYEETFDEYGIIVHDGGPSYVNINYCPWCGMKLRESKRDLWFDTLERLGYDEPSEQDIPSEFHSDKWWRSNKYSQ